MKWNSFCMKKSVQVLFRQHGLTSKNAQVDVLAQRNGATKCLPQSLIGAFQRNVFKSILHYQWRSKRKNSRDVCARDASMCCLWSSMNVNEWLRKAHNYVASGWRRHWVLPHRQYVPLETVLDFAVRSFFFGYLWTSCILFHCIHFMVELWSPSTFHQHHCPKGLLIMLRNYCVTTKT